MQHKKQGTFKCGIVATGDIETLRQLLLKRYPEDQVEDMIDGIIESGIRTVEITDLSISEDIDGFFNGFEMGQKFAREINDLPPVDKLPGSMNLDGMAAQQVSSQLQDIIKNSSYFYVKRDGRYLNINILLLNSMSFNKDIKLTDCYHWEEDKKMGFRFASLEAFELIESKILCGRNVELVKVD